VWRERQKETNRRKYKIGKRRQREIVEEKQEDKEQ
jgi:hypothetical protein